MHRILLFCVVILMSALTARAQVGPSSFDSGDQGWTTLDVLSGETSTAVWMSDGGNPGGSISGFGFAENFVAPATYLGDQSQYYGGLLSFDLKVDSLAGNGRPDHVRLLGDRGTTTLTLTYQIPLPDTANEWIHYEIPLIASQDWTTRGGVTEANFREALGNLKSLEIPADFGVSVEDNPIHLDNVQLVVPEPTSIALLGLGASAWLLLRRRRC